MSRQCSGCESNADCSDLENFQTLKRRFTNQLGGRDTRLAAVLSAEKLVLYSCSLGRYLASREVGLKTAQIRRFLDAFRRKNSSLRRRERKDGGEGVNAQDEAFLLEPRLAYAAGRQPNQVGPLFEVLKPAMERVREVDDFDRLTRFLESVVAYHKYHGGRD